MLAVPLAVVVLLVVVAVFVAVAVAVVVELVVVAVVVVADGASPSVKEDSPAKYPSYCHNRSKACLEGSASNAMPLIEIKSDCGTIPAHHASDPGRTCLTYNPRANRDKESPSESSQEEGGLVVIVVVVAVAAVVVVPLLLVLVLVLEEGIVTEYAVYSPNAASPRP
jgi:hypothetical protein